jgi:hypothetical protein
MVPQAIQSGIGDRRAKRKKENRMEKTREKGRQGRRLML